MNPVLHTRLCERLGIELPIIQTGMGWVSGAWVGRSGFCEATWMCH